MGDHGMAYAPQADEPEAIGGAGGGLPVPGGALDDNVQRRFLRAGRILVAGGWLVLINTAFSNNGRMNAEHVLIGLALLLLGVCLIMLAPVTNQYPTAARAGAAVADVVLFYFFAPGN